MTALRQRMLEDLQIRHYSKTTIRLYLHAVSVFAQHFGKPPDQLDAEHIRLYQLFLIREKQVSLPTFIQVVMCPPLLLYPYAAPENRHRTHPVSPSRKKAAADPQPGRSQSPAASAPQSPPSHHAGLALRLWTPGRRSRPTQSERHRYPSQRPLGAPRKRK